MAKIVESLKRLGVSTPPGEFVASVEESVTPDEQNYVLALCGTQSDADFRIGAALADHTCTVYSAGNEQFTRLSTLEHNQSPIIGVKFSPNSRNIIYTASNNGSVTACDLRAKGRVIAEFRDKTEGKIKPLASFDISCDERLIAGGTEHIGGDAFILFWDIRYCNSKLSSKSNLLGGYWESHIDDITSLSFHWCKRDILASGSTDGLINVFDLKQNSEDSALTYSLNTESSVDRIGWLTNDSLWCTTHTHSLQLWNCEDATPYNKFDRNDLALSESADPDNCYLVKIHSAFGNPFLIAGLSSTKGEILKSLGFGKKQLELYHNFLGNKQIVRDSWLHEKSGCLVTGGEGGIINIWRQTEPLAISRSANNKRPTKIGAEKSRSDKNHRTKPY